MQMTTKVQMTFNEILTITNRPFNFDIYLTF
jgi:hypothetical protein